MYKIVLYYNHSVLFGRFLTPTPTPSSLYVYAIKKMAAVAFGTSPDLDYESLLFRGNSRYVISDYGFESLTIGSQKEQLKRLYSQQFILSFDREWHP